MFVCTTTGCISEDEPQGPSLQVGELLPEFSVTMSDGTVYTTPELRGKVPVIVFFNTNCSDCRKELPVIQQLWEEYEYNDIVKVIAISREESAEEIQEYWKQNGLTLPYSAQETRDVYSLFAPSVIPRIYIANSQGVVTATFDDSALPSFAILTTAIQEAQIQPYEP